MSLKIQIPNPATRAASDNALLGKLLPGDFAAICMDLEHVRLQVHEVLYEPGEEMQFAYFPTAGCISLIHDAEDGIVEVGTIGFEGMAGVPLLLYGTSAPTR